MSKWVPLHNHSMFSLLQGVSKPNQIAKRCNDLGYESCALTDHGNIGAAMQFYSAMTDKGIKPIFGCELYITHDDNELTHLPVLAKNLSGWKNLISISSFSHHKDNFREYPRIDLPTLSNMGHGNLIVFNGHAHSDLANSMFTDYQGAYAQTDYATVKEQFVREDWEQTLYQLANQHIDYFGRDNFFLAIQIIDPDNNPAAYIAARALRYISKKYKIPRVAIANSYYPESEDADDQRVLLCAALETTKKELDKKKQRGEYFPFKSNFLGNKYHIPSLEEIQALHDEEEIANSVRIADMCESYDIRHPPILPVYPCPNGVHPNHYLLHLCKKKWEEKVPEDKWDEYTERVRKELKVIKEAGLASYFLIVQDYCNWARRQGMIVGAGRGCLVAETPIVVADGSTKKLVDVVVGDKIVTRSGNIREVIKKFEYDINEDLIKICSYYGDSEGVILTKDHKVLCENSTNLLEWKTADSIKPGDWVFTPSRPQDGLQDYVIDLARFCDIAGTRFDEQYVYYERYNYLTRFIKLDQWWLTLLGNFVGNGWLGKRKDSRIGIDFSGNIDRIVNGLMERKIDYTITFSQNKNLCHIIIRNPVLRRMFAVLHTKHIPHFISELSNINILTYLKGYFETVTLSKSRKLADQIRHLARLVGLPSSIREEKRKEWGTYYSITLPPNASIGGIEQRYKIIPGGFLTQVMSVESVEGVEKVYDIQIDEESNYLTSSFIVHNSASGCLISYLIGITAVDPIKYGLLFERFYNAGRNAPGHISLPDIDCDFPRGRRKEITMYLKRKFGDDKVANIATFNSMKGRGALTDVLRVYDIPHALVKQITAHIPEEHRITEELKAMKDRGDEPSIIRYALETDPDSYRDWVTIDASGNCDGTFGPYFAQAMRLEGTKRNISMHAAGVVVSSTPLADLCPLFYDPELDGYIVGWDKDDVEAIGGQAKLDILGVAALDKLGSFRNLLRYGYIGKE